jgi:hypothetical protein
VKESGQGKTSRTQQVGAMPRFVILDHDHPERHWDFMLEAGTVLRTWRLKAPLVAGSLTAEAAFDHRLVYLDYEGPVSGNRGEVVRWEAGTFTWIIESVDRVEVDLSGSQLAGHLRLERATAALWNGQFTPATAAVLSSS